MPDLLNNHNDKLPLTGNWKVSTWQQVGPHTWKEKAGVVPVRTKVTVQDQLAFGKWGLSSLLKVKDERGGELVVSSSNFTVADYWNCPVAQGVAIGPLVATVTAPGVKPVDKRSGAWLPEVKKGLKVLCFEKATSSLAQKAAMPDAVVCQVPDAKGVWPAVLPGSALAAN